jgi:hypothetical protein
MPVAAAPAGNSGHCRVVPYAHHSGSICESQQSVDHAACAAYETA